MSITREIIWEIEQAMECALEIELEEAEWIGYNMEEEEAAERAKEDVLLNLYDYSFVNEEDLKEVTLIENYIMENY